MTASDGMLSRRTAVRQAHSHVQRISWSRIAGRLPDHSVRRASVGRRAAPRALAPCRARVRASSPRCARGASGGAAPWPRRPRRPPAGRSRRRLPTARAARSPSSGSPWGFGGCPCLWWNRAICTWQGSGHLCLVVTAMTRGGREGQVGAREPPDLVRADDRPHWVSLAETRWLRFQGATLRRRYR